MPLEPLLTAREAAALRKISRKVICRRARNGDLPFAFRMADEWRVAPTALEAWIRRQSGMEAKPKRGRKLTDYTKLYESYEQRMQ